MVEEKTSEPHLHRINPAMWVSVIALGLAALLSYFLLDEHSLAWFRDHPNAWPKNGFVKVIRGFGSAWVPIWLLLNWVCATGKQRPALAGLLALLLIAPSVCTLKPLVHRPRPREVIAAATQTEKTENNNSSSWNLSFPSGDTAVAFAVAAALAPFVRWPWGLLFFSIASSVGFLRVVVLAHYPSDVCAGAAIGILSGWLALQIIRRWLSQSNLRPGHAAAGAIITPALFGLIEGIDNLLTFLKTYGVLVVGIYIVAKGGTWLKRLRRRDFCGYFKTTEGPSTSSGQTQRETKNQSVKL
jgi:membrane-associated phospholipid phosphatase